MTTFIVEGRRFQKNLHAVTYARHQAKLLNREVQVLSETSATTEKRERKWMATLYPPGTRKTMLRKTA